MSSKIDLGPWEMVTPLPDFRVTVRIENMRDAAGVTVIMLARKGETNYQATEQQPYDALLSRDGEGAFWQVKNRLLDKIQAMVAENAPSSEGIGPATPPPKSAA